MRRPGRHRAAAASASARLHGFLFNKWYFDELHRRARLPARRSRSGASPTRSSSGVVVDGIVDGATGLVRGAGVGRPRRAVGLRARLRAAAGRRLRRARRLLPGGRVEPDAERAALGAAGRRGAGAGRAAGGGALGRGASARWSRSGSRSGWSPTSTPAPPGLQHVVDESWIPDLGVRYQLGVDGISVFLVLLTARAVVRGDRCGRRCAAIPRTAARALLLPARARRDRGAGRLPRPGPAAVRPLLRPDADPVLLPDRDLRRRRADRGDDEDDRLHAGRLAADAGRRDRDRDPRLRARPASSASRSRTCARTCSRAAARSGSSASSPPPSWSRCRPSRSTAGCPTPTAPAPLPVRPAALRRCSRRSAPTASCGSCCRSSRRRRSTFQELIMVIARRLDPLRLGDGVHADQRPPDRRLLVDRPARLHHPRDLQPARRRRRRRGAADGQPRARRRRRSSS